ncbi:MAG: hypothetical protein AAFN11_11645, partial [Chloroflexota bacterium]
EILEDVAQPQSTAFDASFGADIAGTGEFEIDPISFTLTANGAYIVDEDAYEEAIDEFAEVELLDISPRVILDLLRGQFEAIDAELEIDYEFPAELGVPPLGPFNLYITDGVGYVDFTPFSVFDPSLEGTYGVDMFDLIEVPLQGVEAEVLLEALEEIANSLEDFDPSDMDGGENPFDAFAEGFNSGLDSATLTEEDLEDAVTLERLDDAEINGFDVVVFQMSFDFAELFAIEAAAQQAYDQAIQSGLPEDEVSFEDFQDALIEAFDGSEMTIVTAYDSEDGYMVETSVAGDFIIQAAPIASLTGDQVEGELSFIFESVFTRDDINDVDEIDLPSDAEEIPVEQLLGITGF